MQGTIARIQNDRGKSRDSLFPEGPKMNVHFTVGIGATEREHRGSVISLVGITMRKVLGGKL